MNWKHLYKLQIKQIYRSSSQEFFIEMAKQKIVVKVSMSNNRKTRKAMKIAVAVSGVESASLMGSDKDEITVTGEGIDSVELAKLLRKGVGYTELVSVGPVEEETAAAGETEVMGVPLEIYPHHYSSYDVPPYHVYESPYNNDPYCTIM